MLLIGCTRAEPQACEHDDTAATWVCEGELTLQVGASVGEAHVALEEGEALLMERGTQGLQHLLLSILLPWEPEALPVGRVSVQLSAWVDGVRVAEPYRVGLAVVDADPGSRIPVLRWVVDEPDRIVDQELHLLVGVEAVGLDELARGELTAPVRWRPGDEPPEDTDP